jgi:hypothetical protein
MKEKDMRRNRPAERGNNNDPYLRDEDATAPGANTISSNDRENDNQRLSETAKDNFREEPADPRADKNLDD